MFISQAKVCNGTAVVQGIRSNQAPAGRLRHRDPLYCRYRPHQTLNPMLLPTPRRKFCHQNVRLPRVGLHGLCDCIHGHLHLRHHLYLRSNICLLESAQYPVARKAQLPLCEWRSHGPSRRHRQRRPGLHGCSNARSTLPQPTAAQKGKDSPPSHLCRRALHLRHRHREELLHLHDLLHYLGCYV